MGRSSVDCFQGLLPQALPLFLQPCHREFLLAGWQLRVLDQLHPRCTSFVSQISAIATAEAAEASLATTQALSGAAAGETRLVLHVPSSSSAGKHYYYYCQQQLHAVHGLHTNHDHNNVNANVNDAINTKQAVVTTVANNQTVMVKAVTTTI